MDGISGLVIGQLFKSIVCKRGHDLANDAIPSSLIFWHHCKRISRNYLKKLIRRNVSSLINELLNDNVSNGDIEL